MQMSDRCGSVSIFNTTENCSAGPAVSSGECLPQTDIISTLWSVILLLDLNHSFLNREYTHMYVPKALATILRLWILHVTFLS